MCYTYGMTNTDTTNQFSLDPVEIGITLVAQDRKVNDLPVIAMMPAPTGGGLVVLCHRVDEPTRVPDFVTWIIWRTEDGRIAAQTGHYDMTLEEGLVDLHERAGNLANFQRLMNTEVERFRRSAY